MSGEISVKKRDWKKELLMMAVIFGIAFTLTGIFMRFLTLQPLTRGAVGALVAYLIAREGYRRLYPGGTVRRIAWTLTDAELTLDGESIPRTSIRAVHCWENRNAFGQSRPGWVVNIETTHQNKLLRSADAEGAADELATLVKALGGNVPAS